MKSKNIAKKLEELFTNNRGNNCKLTKEKFAYDDSKNPISSETRILTNIEASKPLIIDKTWNRDENGLLTSVTSSVRPEETKKSIMPRRKAAETNPVFEEKVLASYKYNSDGNPVKVDLTDKMEQTTEYFNSISRKIVTNYISSGVVKTVTYDDNNIVVEESEYDPNTDQTIIIQYDYKDTDITNLKSSHPDYRNRNVKILNKGNVKLQMSTLEKYDKNLDTYIVVKRDATEISGDIYKHHIEITVDTEDYKEWTVSDATEVKDTLVYEDNSFTSKSTGYKVTNLFPKGESTLSNAEGILGYSFWVFDTDYMPTDGDVIRVTKDLDNNRLISRISNNYVDTYKYTSSDYQFSASYAPKLILEDNKVHPSKDEKYISFILDSDDLSVKVDKHLDLRNLTENNKYDIFSRVVYNNTEVTLRAIIDDKDAENFINYVMEEIGALPLFNKVNS